MLHWKAKLVFLVVVVALVASFLGDLEGFVW
jgi:hypothetical protein